MQNLSKRQWGHQLSIKQAADIAISWCIRAREKNVLRKKPPKIFYSYIVEDTPPLQYLQNISSVFKYSQKDMPYTDQSRDTLLRCLSVAIKAHFFLFPNDVVSYEPYFFTIPSLNDPNNTIYGLIYKIEKDDKSIIVCERNLIELFDKPKVVYQFPAVVIEDSFRWFSLKNWNIVKQAANISEFLEKPWINKKQEFLAQDAKTRFDLERHATILDVPYEIKDFIKPLGIEWSKTIKVWYLPKGFDVDSVLEYIEYIKKEHPPLDKEKHDTGSQNHR
ncbi:hypothetical protein GW796_00660 [archaeon]|nr:hypothetical protein [archaeon]NCQ50416.1 hypothetical protein [archaeon]